MIDRAEDHCPRCHGRRERQIDRRTGRYNVALPSRCPTKDACTAEMMSGWDFVTDAELRRATLEKDQ